MTGRLGWVLTLILLLALFFGVNILAGAALRGARVDLTEDKLYTLSEGSRNIARGLAEPVHLTLFYSRRAADGRPAYQTHAARVQEMLDEFRRASGGKITLDVVDPEPFSEEEDRAVQAGLRGDPGGGFGTGQTVYLGLLGVNTTDGREVIPMLHPSREEFFEYEIARLLYVLDNPDPPKVGLITTLPMRGNLDDPTAARQRPQQPWQILTQMEGLFEVEPLGREVDSIPGDVRILMVVHPKGLPESTLYAIDQFVLGGGRALVFVDPICDSDIPEGHQNELQALLAPRGSDMPELLEAWGLRMAHEQVAADLDNARRVVVGTPGRQEVVDYVGYLALGPDNLDREDAVTGQLGLVHLATAGVLEPAEGATTEFTRLMWTSTNSQRLAVDRVRFIPEPKAILGDFVPGGQELTVAARVAGSARTAFPGGLGGDAGSESRPTEDAGSAEGTEEAGSESRPTGRLAESVEPINVIVVADVDMLVDRFWMEQTIFGPRKTADNLDFVLSALDNLGGSTDLLNIRARARFTRPLDVVESIRREAELRHQREIQELERRARDAQMRINELQRQRGGEDGGAVLLTPEQAEELERFREEQAEARRRIREVRHSMNREIDRLGWRMTILNTALVPLVVALAAGAIGVYRVNRRRSGKVERGESGRATEQHSSR